jgi:DNA-directed RNA polymerase subunit RPC12/RpoP
MPQADAGTWEWMLIIGGVLVFVILFGAIVFVSINERKSSSSRDDDDDDDEAYIRCPECDEKIRESSFRCKYCDARID